MRILMTGFTPRGVNSSKLLYSYMSNTDVIKQVLVSTGHEVDHRVVDVEEPNLAASYDVALIALALPQSLSSRYVYGALWAAEQLGERARFFVDDWLLYQMKGQLESGIRNPEKRFYSLDNRHCFETAKQHTDLWLRWFKHLAYGRYRLLLPSFPFGNKRKLLPGLDSVEPVIFDPTPLALTDPRILCGSDQPLNIRREDPEDRERTWTLAAMRDVSPWFNKQRFSWPVVRYGNKRQKEPIVTERELVEEIYPRRWGIIGAPYPVSGSGGWRVRYVHAAVTDSILFLDPEEGRVAGPPYDLFRSVVEKASTDELMAIATRQRDHLLASTWSLDQLTAALLDYVRVQ